MLTENINSHPILQTGSNHFYYHSMLKNTYCFSEEPEVIALEFSISNKKWLLQYIYKEPAQIDSSFLNKVKIALNLCSKPYDNFLLVGDFNMSPNNSNLKDFMNSFFSDNLIKQPMCFKSFSSKAFL